MELLIETAWFLGILGTLGFSIILLDDEREARGCYDEREARGRYASAKREAVTPSAKREAFTRAQSARPLRVRIQQTSTSTTEARDSEQKLPTCSTKPPYTAEAYIIAL